MIRRSSSLRILAASLLSVTMLTACSTFDRLANVGEAPALSPIENPTLKPGYQPVSVPMPDPVTTVRQPNSLWVSGSKSFFKDQRASQVGDILTVVIDLDESAEMENTSTRSRSSTENTGIDAMLGYEESFNRLLPEAIDNTNLLQMDTESEASGTGSIDREEKIELRVAALVSQILPNGNLVINGRQEVRVNFEVRELQIAGIIRPEDIQSDNTIVYDKIAEARIAYGGRGQITDVQQPRLGTQVIDVLMPF